MTGDPAVPGVGTGTGTGAGAGARVGTDAGAGPGPGASGWVDGWIRGWVDGGWIRGSAAVRTNEVSATPPTNSAAAPQRSGVTDSSSSRAADDMPNTGTRRVKGATADAG